MQNNWKGFTITCFMTGALMSLVLLWDSYALNSKIDILYCLIKGTTILSMLGMGIVSYHHRKSFPVFEDLYCLLFYVYSFYGMACIDMTYVYSFMEAYFVSALVIRQETTRFMITSVIGFLLTIGGFALTSEPVFVAQGQSYKPHAFTITFLFYAIAVTSHFVITRYQKKFLALNEKFALIGKQSSFLMHEIKNPLNRVVANSENEVSAEIMNDIRSDSQKISGLIASVETLIHNPSDLVKTFIKFDLSEIESMLIRDYGSYISSMRIEYDFSELRGHFYGNKFLVYQLLKNLIVNAFEAIGYKTDEHTFIKIQVQRSEELITFNVINSGSSISSRNLTQIFDPHFTTKQNRTNKGLGLSLVKSIVEGHRGQISVESKDNITSFKVQFPDYAEAVVESGAKQHYSN